MASKVKNLIILIIGSIFFVISMIYEKYLSKIFHENDYDAGDELQ